MKVGRDMKWAQTFQFVAICMACGVLVSSCDKRTEDTQQVSVSQDSLPGFDLTILEGATLIDGTGAPAIVNSSILLRGDTIIGVGRVGEFLGADSATVIDVSGKTIVPPGQLEFLSSCRPGFVAVSEQHSRYGLRQSHRRSIESLHQHQPRCKH